MAWRGADPLPGLAHPAVAAAAALHCLGDVGVSLLYDLTGQEAWTGRRRLTARRSAWTLLELCLCWRPAPGRAPQALLAEDCAAGGGWSKQRGAAAGAGHSEAARSQSLLLLPPLSLVVPLQQSSFFRTSIRAGPPRRRAQPPRAGQDGVQASLLRFATE